MDPPHFHLGFHPEHGFVARPTTSVSPHLAEWYLTREQFEQVPGTPGLYRLARPEQDGKRRSRQAVKDLRAHGFTVQADPALDPDLTPAPRSAAVRSELTDPRRSRRAEASSMRSPQQHGPVPSTARPTAGGASPASRPLHAPAGPVPLPHRGRSR